MKRHAMDTVLIMLTLVIACASSPVHPFLKFDRNLRIVGGSPARPNQFPHAAALILHLTQQRSSFCGGSIINIHYILTAAHCLEDVTRVEVQAGVHNIFRGTPEFRATVLPRDLRVHPQYNSDTLLNDIGLVFVLARIPLGNSMQRIALPPRSQINNRFVGSIGTVIGWGRTSDTTQALSDALRFVALPVLPDQVCNEVYNHDYRFFNPTNICLSGEHGSSCNGDSGGGFHVTMNGEMTIIGLVSYGSSTCASGHPPVVTRVTSYLDWISANTGIRIM